MQDRPHQHPACRGDPGVNPQCAGFSPLSFFGFFLFLLTRMWKSLPVLRKVNGSSRDISAEKLLLRRHSGASGSQRKPPPRQTSVAVTAGRRRWSQWADRSSGRDAGGLRSRQSATGTPSSVASPGVRLLGLIPSQSAGTLPRFKLSSGGRHGPAPRALHLHLPRETLDGPVLNLTWVAAGGWGRLSLPTCRRVCLGKQPTKPCML